MNYINEIQKAIAKALFNSFNYPIYIDEIKSDAQFPCFVIETLNTEQKHLLDIRYERRNDFDIMFFISDDDYIEAQQEQINPITESLYFDLEYITLSDGSLLNGIDMSHRITDGILHFKVSYEDHILKTIKRDILKVRHDADPMLTLHQNQEVSNAKSKEN